MKTSCVRCHFGKFDIYFLAPIKRIFFGVITALTLEKCKKECNMLKIILVQDFCPLKIKITQFPGGFPFYLTHCKNHWEFSIAFERYCSEVDLKYENFKRVTSTNYFEKLPWKVSKQCRSIMYTTEISPDVLTICSY